MRGYYEKENDKPQSRILDIIVALRHSLSNIHLQSLCHSNLYYHQDLENKGYGGRALPRQNE